MSASSSKKSLRQGSPVAVSRIDNQGLGLKKREEKAEAKKPTPAPVKSATRSAARSAARSKKPSPKMSDKNFANYLAEIVDK
mmetsp:Transcript_30016/g.21773  ORF Transcript_30016/g.21773 Transcript_30016/m.21773 type:complete len:82 (-) Transcript_30016:101-346(-)